VAEDGRVDGRPMIAHERDQRLVHDALLLPAGS
jgi:hypothetical protein